MESLARANRHSSQLAKVVIIGCGLIGALWDSPETSQAYSLTHAAGFSKHPACTLLAFCDADLAKAQAACQRWNVPHAYDEVVRMLDETAPDIVVIAASSASRLALLLPVLNARVKLVIIEKPLATSLAECRAVVAAIEQSQSMALVNYSRHWDQSLLDLRARIVAGEWGQIQRLQAWYGKGLSNNASHMIDLVGILCGAQPHRVRARATPLPGHEAAWSEGKDPALDAQIIYRCTDGREIQLDLLALDHTAFTCFELRLVMREALLEIALGGRQIRLSTIIDDPHYAHYRIPGEPTLLPSANLQAMDQMVAEAIALVQGQHARPSCDAQMALHTALTVAAIKDSLAQQEAWLEIA